jgi:two-component system sensor histidine kinase PilS (NtrC family)
VSELSESNGGSRAQNENFGSGNRDPNVRLLMWRLLLAAFLSVSSLFVHYFGSKDVSAPGLLGSLGLLFTTITVCWAAYLAGAPRRLLLSVQLAADTLCIGLLVHFSGGPYSAFPLMFLVPIMLGAYYRDARWSMTIAGIAAILIGGGHFGLALGWLMTGTETTLDYLHGWPVFVTALHMGVFLVTGMISGGLARRLAKRRQDQARSHQVAQKARCEVRNILDNIQSGLITVNGKGVITRVNPSACRILQLTPRQLLKQDIRGVMADGMQELTDTILPVATGGEAVTRGEIHIHRRGARMPLGLNVNHVTGLNGRVIGAITIFTDLTREKEMSARIRESDRLAAIGELAASIAHEIRNPLASIRGSVEILAGELELEGYQNQLLGLVLKESARVNTIINDFLAYSRMPAATKSCFEAKEFRDQISLQIRQHVAAKAGRVGVDCVVGQQDMEIVADSGQLTQMTLNLAINACEAMAYEGELHIGLNLLGDGDTYELVVTDNGPGIDPEIREHLFSPFKTTKEGGTGLGLSIVARIAAAHGGSVRAEDNPGGGAIFRVRWPMDRKLLATAGRTEGEVEVGEASEAVKEHIPAG